MPQLNTPLPSRLHRPHKPGEIPSPFLRRRMRPSARLLEAMAEAENPQDMPIYHPRRAGR